MIDANPVITTKASQQLRDGQAKAENEPTPTFSYALASTTLQSQAATSLEVHGAAPSQGAAATNGSQQSDNHSETRGEWPSRQSETQHTRSEIASQPNKQANQPPASVIDRTQQSLTPTSAPITSTPVASPAIAAAAPLNIQQSATQPKEAAILREAATTKETLRTQRTEQAAKSAPAAPPQQEFARLLARRLDTATSFDLRLDPPELGRVEGRFTVGDDGKSVLSLKFDNQSAFDLFAKDEAALRAALNDAGFDLGDSGLDFTLDNQANTEATTLSSTAIETPLADMISYDPVFSAAFSSGAIDIRI